MKFWIGKVDNLVIELHGPKCEEIFAAAIAKEDFRVEQSDELRVCKRIG